MEILSKRQKMYLQLQSWASMAPLIACILGPLSILLGIPALTQRWRAYVVENEVIYTLPDPRLNIILAAFALLCEVTANAILMLRFSNIALRVTTPLSLALWIAKVAFCLGNYGQFIIVHPQPLDLEENWRYSEAFWIGIASMIISAIVIIFLILNLTIAPVKKDLGIHERAIQEQHRLAHRGFMFRVLILVVSMGFGSLAFSKLEGFSFITGLYLVTASILTVGFGDVAVVTTAGRIILFPYLVFSVTYVALMVSSIANLIDERLDAQKQLREHMQHMSRLAAQQQADRKSDGLQSSKLFDMPSHGVEDAEFPTMKNEFSDVMVTASKAPVVNVQMLPLKRTMTLQEEIEIQTALTARLENRRQIRNIFLALLFFSIFWFIGALVFAFSEGWEYGTSMYFCYVFFMTVGYGDYSPKSQLGRVLFIVYAMIAVPTVTFLVQVFVEAANISKYVYNSKRSRQKRIDELDTRELRHIRNATAEADKDGEMSHESRNQMPMSTNANGYTASSVPLQRARTLSRTTTIEADRTLVVTQTFRVPRLSPKATSPRLTRSRSASVAHSFGPQLVESDALHSEAQNSDIEHDFEEDAEDEDAIVTEDTSDLAMQIVRAEIDIRSRLLQNARKLDHLTRLLISPHLHSEARLLLSLEMGRLDIHYRHLLQILSKSARYQVQASLSHTSDSNASSSTEDGSCGVHDGPNGKNGNLFPDIEMEDTKEAEWLGLTGIERERKFVEEYRQSFASLIADVEELVRDVVPASLDHELEARDSAFRSSSTATDPAPTSTKMETHDRSVLHRLKSTRKQRKAHARAAQEEKVSARDVVASPQPVRNVDLERAGTSKMSPTQASIRWAH